MSNILIIKHGSLGDIVQISGILKDIKNHHKKDKIFILTTLPYIELLSLCPYLDGVILDKRLPRWNIFYLLKLKKMLKKFNFSHIYDLQNSSRTSFYRKYLLKDIIWCSTETILDKNENKKDFDKESVLERFKMQLNKSNILTNYTLIPDFTWAATNIDNIVNKYFGKKFILIFPFCSPQLTHKKWPYYNQLIKLIKNSYNNFEIVLAPGPNEIEEAKKINAITIMNNNRPLNIMELAGLIKKASFIIANDTGPAHMAAHLNKKGVVFFGYHTTPKKVSIETTNFKPMIEQDLKNLTSEKVYLVIKKQLDLIN
jgi:ADP-heptose:LPS heptosyltransferase